MEYFSIVAKWVSSKSAQPLACFLAFLMVLVWGFLGPLLHFSNTWQLIISTLAAVTSIIMLFIIQNSQHRHTVAIQLKLDEIIRKKGSSLAKCKVMWSPKGDLLALRTWPVNPILFESPSGM